MKKRYGATVLALALLLTAGSGCQAEPAEEGNQVLEVVTDSWYKQEVEWAGDFFERENAGWQVTVQVLPREQQERDAAVQKMKTEAMAGEGPDVYILGTAHADAVEDEYEEPVFSSVPNTMESGVFAVLDDYMEKDVYWKSAPCHPEILKAGQLGGKQYVLPLGCRYCFYYHPEGEGAMNGKTLEEWMAQAASSEREPARRAVQDAMFQFMRSSLIQPAVDYENQKSLFDAELWADTVNAWFPDYLATRFEEREEGAPYGMLNWAGDFVNLPSDVAFQAVPDMLGRRTAAITVYGAVGQSSDIPEEAYDYLMLFLDERRGNAQTDTSDGYVSGEFPVQEWSWKELLKQTGREDLTEPFLESFRELDSAYFPGEPERELEENFFHIINYSDTTPEDERIRQVEDLAEQYARTCEILAKE
ncbi:hypothetical protein K280104A7_30590 [Candidatus Bariatricus faecipullorum]